MRLSPIGEAADRSADALVREFASELWAHADEASALLSQPFGGQRTSPGIRLILKAIWN